MQSLESSLRAAAYDFNDPILTAHFVEAARPFVERASEAVRAERRRADTLLAWQRFVLMASDNAERLETARLLAWMRLFHGVVAKAARLDQLRVIPATPP